jgi:hypothetical protein
MKMKMKRTTVAEMARKRGIKPQTVYARMASGWTLERALSQPVMLRKPRKKAAAPKPIDPPLVQPEKVGSAWAASLALAAAIALVAYLFITAGIN